MQQANGWKIVGHLVNKYRFALGAMDLCKIEVVLTQAFEMFFTQLSHRIRIIDTVRPVTIERCCHQPGVGKFGSPLNLAMAGQNLLDHRRPGPWQTNDKYWLFRWMAKAGVCSKKLLSENLDDPVVHDFGTHRVIILEHPLTRVSVVVITPGLLIIATILKGFCQREQNIYQ